MLKYVTLTGADNSVEPKDLIELSREFPLVEWGILIGGSQGVERMPSFAWIEKLIDLKQAVSFPVNLSLHICGQWLRKIMAGQSILPEFPWAMAFERCQLNFHGEHRGNVGENILKAFCEGQWEPQVIFQLDGVNYNLHLATARRYAVAGLFDQSHGAGLLPNCWPQARPDFPCGYAGGLGPDNVLSQLELIMHQGRPNAMGWWIDMETKLYSKRGEHPGMSTLSEIEAWEKTPETYFDLAKCRAVLETVTKDWVVTAQGQ
jgi:hypothetical protein